MREKYVTDVVREKLRETNVREAVCENVCFREVVNDTEMCERSCEGEAV